jgi:hypothetical protein
MTDVIIAEAARTEISFYGKAPAISAATELGAGGQGIALLLERE